MLDWREVDLGGAAVRGLADHVPWGRHVLAYGGRPDAPFAAVVRSDGTVVRDDDDLDGGPVWSATGDEDHLYVHGVPPRVRPDDWSCSTGSTADPPVRGWVACGGSRAVTVTLSRGGELFVAEPDEEPVGGLWLASPADADRLAVAGLVDGAVVAGPLGREPGAATTSAWRAGEEEWLEVPGAGAVDAWTAAYEGPLLLAGHRAGLPVVHGADGAVEAPEVRLDPAHPVVDVMHDRGDGWPGERDARPCLAVQAEEGIQVWLPHEGGWTMLPGPAGRLAAARLARRDRDTAWCLADGRLWIADLSAAWGVLDPVRG